MVGCDHILPLLTGAWITPSDGTIEFEMKLKTETHCPLTFTKFPFDSQVSYVRLRQWITLKYSMA